MDPLGFAVFAALVVTQPQLFGHGWKAIQRGWAQAKSRYPYAERVLTMWTSEQFLKLAVVLAIAEYFWLNYLPDSGKGLGFESNYWWLLALPLSWAVLNFLLSMGSMVDIDQTTGNLLAPGHGEDDDDVLREWQYGVPGLENFRAAHPSLDRFLNGYNRFRKFAARIPLVNFVLSAHPIIWLALVAGGWLLQGSQMEYYAISYVADHSDAQWMIAYGWFSKVVYGIIALTASGVLGWFVVKSTRFIEQTSTVLAKLIVSIPIGIEYDKNALAEIGGPVDILDEDNIASKISWALTVLFIPLLVFDMTVFLWPDPIIAGAILVGIVFTGLLEFVFGRMAPGTESEAKSDRTKRMRVIFKMGPVVSIIAFVLGNFIAETLTGWNLRVEVGNAWYGLSYWVHVVSFWFGVGCAAFMLVAQKYIRKAYDSLAAGVKAAEAKGDVEGWSSSPKRYASWVALLGFSGASAAAFVLAFSAFATACGSNDIVRLDHRLNSDAVTFENVVVNGKLVTAKTNDPWPLAAPVNGRVSIEFDTPERAFGVVEFDSAREAERVGMPGYVTVDSTMDKVNGKYHHVAEFDVDPEYYGAYRVLMRNANVTLPKPKAKPKVKGGTDPLYGRVATSQPFELVKPPEVPFYKGWWGSLCAWWDSWSLFGPDKKKPRTVIVRSAPRPHGGSAAPRRCTSGCKKLPPTKVVPGLRNEVAAARNRR